MSSEEKKLKAETLKYMVDHVFLPPILPQERGTEIRRKDFALLSLVDRLASDFAEAASASAHGDSATKVWDIIGKMLKGMDGIYATRGIGKDELGQAIETMIPNDVLPVFVKAQNAGIIFRKINSDILTFEAFEVSLPSKVVVGAPGKITMCFPPNPRLPFTSDKLVISTLSNVLEHLSTSTMQESMATSNKGGDTHHETRDTASPRFITEALAGIIRAIPPNTNVKVDQSYIEKRLDDHVLWNSTLKPWRRSSMWLIIRVALQTTLKQHDMVDLYGYKAFQVFVLASLLNMALSSDPEIFNCDLLVFMNNKLVRRLRKLGQIIEGANFRPIRFAMDTVARAATATEARWKEVRELHEMTVQWDPSSATDTEQCLNFSFPHSRPFLLELIDRHEDLREITNNFDSDKFEASLKQSLPAVSFTRSASLPDIAGHDTETALQIVEIWIETHLDAWERSTARSEQDCLPLAKIIAAYQEMASVHYKGVPERISLMHLCLLELWVALDKICIRWCRLLEQYSPEIAQTFTDPLLLPYFAQMKRLDNVQSYLRNRHQRARAFDNRSIFKEVDAETSFHNQFFESSNAASLIELEDRIRRDAADQAAKKIIELQSYNQKHEGLIKQYQQNSCLPSVPGVNKYGKPVLKHPRWICPRCQPKDKAEKLRIVPLEDLLPKRAIKARPIVFELRCPLPFATWRESTIKIILSLLGVDIKPPEELYPLREYEPLRVYFREPYAGCQIGFASSTKSLARSHYGKGFRLPAVEANVLFRHKGTFTVFDGVAEEAIAIAPSEGKLRATCTLQVNGPYEALQSYIDDTNHSPNSVIASISKAPQGISPAEYKTFGLLRAGNRLQWRNIMAAIKSQTLSFSEPAVFALILQCIWQAGPVDADETSEGIHREAHIDLMDKSFGTQVANELLRNIETLGNNWKQVNFLAILITLSLRLYAFTTHSEVKAQIRRVLDEARSLSIMWINAIRTSLSPQEKLSGHGYNELADYRPQALANVAVVLRASFDIEGGGSAVFPSNKDAVMYIYATILVSAVHTRSFDYGLRILASRHERTALRIEPHLIAECLKSTTIISSVLDLAWPDHSDCGDWKALPSCRGLWWTSTEVGLNPATFYFNPVKGSFLIDGKAFDRLPAEYGNNPDYISLFKDHVFREVYPSKLLGMQYRGCYRGHELHFGMNNQRMIVLCVGNDGIQEYIPSRNIEEDLPAVSSERNCFWYSSNRRKIETRHLTYSWTDDDEEKWTIQLQNYRSRSVGRVESRNQEVIRNAVDPESGIHRSLAKTFAPLEPDLRQICITVQGGDTTVVAINLTRHNIGFCLTQNRLECLTLPGYIVDINLAGIGCLFGLRSILNLRHSDLRHQGRKIIIPKGPLVVSPGLYGHAQISVEIGKLGGYFVYDIDNVVGRLVGTRTMESDLYLIKMHAFTASSLPDPLTQQPGTTEALELLASASSVSDFTLSQESRSYLDDSMALTPLRTYYPSHLRVMETVTWNRFLPASAQHPAFRSLVEDIISSWKNTEFFSQIGDLASMPEPIPGMEHLIRRASLRHWSYLPIVGLEYSEGDTKYSLRDALADPASRDREKTVFQAASLLQGGSSGFPICKDLRKVILGWKRMTGVQQWGWDNVGHWLRVPKAVPMKENWCTFYDLCCHQASPGIESIVALAFQSFRGVPLDLLATLGAVMSNPRVPLVG